MVASRAPSSPTRARVRPAQPAKPQWPADRVERWPLAKLIPYARNARTHSDAQVAQIAASIREWGWTMPVLVDEQGSLIAGHGRVLAAHRLDLTDVPTMVARGWTRAQIQAYRIADNQLALGAGWNTELLTLELADLSAMAFDLSLLGFGEGELARHLSNRQPGLTDPDEAPPLPEEPVTQPGDLWVCGRHRVLCGDATSRDDVTRVCTDVRPHLMVTDPPYGVDYDPAWRNRAAAAGKIGQKRASRAIGEVTNDDRADWREAWALFPGDVVYVWHASTKAAIVQESLEAAGLLVRTQVIWAKNNFAIGRGHYHVQHEPCWYAVKNGATGHWAGDRSQTTLWQIDKPMKSETGHSTQKPVECIARPIENNSSPGQAVYDPFVGSGTTMIAAEQTGRTCIAIEIAPGYVDVAVKRWQAFTGNQAWLKDDGRHFDEIAAERKPPPKERGSRSGRAVAAN
jgi:DNA modification methylase